MRLKPQITYPDSSVSVAVPSDARIEIIDLAHLNDEDLERAIRRSKTSRIAHIVLGKSQ